MYSTLLAGKAVGIVTILYYVYCIVGGCCTFIVGYGCIRRHFNDWEYIRRLQNKFMANDAARSCFSSKLCNFIYGIFSVYYAYFRCSCRSISIQNAERIEHWRELFGRSVSITTANLSDMKTSYINNQFCHTYYCYQNNGGLSLVCEHGSSVKLGGLLQHPVLYLIELDFKRRKEYNTLMQTQLNRSSNYTELDLLNFIFFSIMEGPNRRIYEDRNAYDAIKSNLEHKIHYLCLVLENFPNQIDEDLQDADGIFLVEAVGRVWMEYDIQLVYKVR